MEALVRPRVLVPHGRGVLMLLLLLLVDVVVVVVVGRVVVGRVVWMCCVRRVMEAVEWVLSVVGSMRVAFLGLLFTTGGSVFVFARGGHHYTSLSSRPRT